MPKSYQYRYLLTLALTYLILGLSTRLFLCLAFPVEGVDQANLIQAALVGLVNDGITFVYLGALPAALILLPTFRIRKAPGFKTKSAAFIFFALLLGFWLFGAAAEYFFWEEFGSRFNFIAVDYLIYTKELINNIIESYNLPLILSGIFVVALFLSGLILKLTFGEFQIKSSGLIVKNSFFSRKKKSAYLLAMSFWLILLGGLHWGYQPPAVFKNNLANEISYNGLYRLFSAYWHNQLDYRQFYPVMADDEALGILKDELGQSALSWDQRPESLARLVDSPRAERRLNVVQIVVESLGSDLLGEDTPNLNRLISEGLYFSNLRATGTRTVRGLEALTLGVPPTPGSSIVRRPGNDGLFNIGSVFQDRGYETSFIYGGFGYFDNMNAFFAGNGWKVIDRYSMNKSDISFANVWGVCDEDLYKVALKSADASFEEGRSFYQFLLTTSNHRPFTYPEGKVDLPSGQSRRGAVQYTDHALGKFLDEARGKPWFKDTLFVIVADHTAGIAGKTVIPPQRYLIPALIYGPGHIASGRINTLASQIDLPPTILALLGLDYEGAFFGQDILSMRAESGRAYLGTYQLLGLMDNNSLTILAPSQKPITVALGETALDNNYKEKMVKRTIAAYQTAQDFFVDGRMKNRFLAGIKIPRQWARSQAQKAAGKKDCEKSTLICDN